MAGKAVDLFGVHDAGFHVKAVHYRRLQEFLECRGDVLALPQAQDTRIGEKAVQGQIRLQFRSNNLSMGSNPMRQIFWFLPLFVATFMLPAYADEAQTCDDETIKLVAVWARFEGKLVSADEADDGGDGLVVAAACKAMPNAPGTTIAAIAFDTSEVVRETNYPEQRDILRVIALVEVGKVVAAHRSNDSEDAVVQYDRDSYRIDTARYKLSKDVRAFGVVFDTAGRKPSAVDAWTDKELTLWIREGENLRAVFGTNLYGWVYIDSIYRDGRFAGVRAESAEMTISVEKTLSHGFADLAITARVMQWPCGEQNDEYDCPETIRKVVVNYNGQSYGLDYDSTFWWSPSVRQKWGLE